jgi:hypothetical protein
MGERLEWSLRDGYLSRMSPMDGLARMVRFVIVSARKAKK